MLQWLLCYRSCCRPSFFGPIHAMRFNTGAQCFEPCPLKQWHDSFADSRSSPFEPMICSTVLLSLSLFSPRFVNVSPLFSPFFRFHDSMIGENDFSHQAVLYRLTRRQRIIIYPRHCSRGWNAYHGSYVREKREERNRSTSSVHTFFQSRRLCAVVSGSLFFFFFSPPELGNWKDNRSAGKRFSMVLPLFLPFINFVINFAVP